MGLHATGRATMDITVQWLLADACDARRQCRWTEWDLPGRIRWKLDDTPAAAVHCVWLAARNSTTDFFASDSVLLLFSRLHSANIGNIATVILV